MVEQVRSEYAAGRVRLDEVVIRAPEPAPMVEVFHVDLVLVLKNVVRNAILAVGKDDPPRRIGLDVTTEVEPTGEETVRVNVRGHQRRGAGHRGHLRAAHGPRPRARHRRAGPLRRHHRGRGGRRRLGQDRGRALLPRLRRRRAGGRHGGTRA
ncbi:MAG: hypothetical protein M5U28_44420 [Sandaracinaceae bacterium]|nr:hypothetical protein [Sandaracinaceae bacterium]